MRAYIEALLRYFDFSGRSSRSEFWLFNLFWFLEMAGLVIVAGAAGTTTEAQKPYDLLLSLVIFAHVIPALAIQVRRLHDIGRSGWWVLISLVPLGVIAALVWQCTESMPGANPYGPNPRDRALRVGPKSGSPAPAPVPPSPVLSPASPVPPPARADADLRAGQFEQLERLSALWKSGAIDDDEFKQMKARILGTSQQQS